MTADRSMATAVLPDLPSPWHEGELLIQRYLGVAEKMDMVGRRVIRPLLTDQHRFFYPELPFVVLGTVDHDGDAWATLRTGRPGFLQAPDPTTLEVTLGRDPDDPAEAGMDDGDGIALLGIELHTRRRNRVNGIIHRETPQQFSISVSQSFGNCPRYIHPRDLVWADDPGLPPRHEAIPLARLGGRAAELIKEADTFFVASYVPGDDGVRHPDVSHRGGGQGFVRLNGDGSLTIPDFSGNRFFNTLGNLVVNPKSGLVFVDFETGDLLQMTGDAMITLDNPEPDAFPEAERLWQFHPRRIFFRPRSFSLRLASNNEASWRV
jgi:predicted pyridoxine 5'-phosphate oxidase superfamily flavin-nucleotide-binding protein